MRNVIGQQRRWKILVEKACVEMADVNGVDLLRRDISVRQRLKVVDAQGRRMAAMVDRLLALAALEHREGLDAPLPLDLAALAAEALDDAAPRAQARDVAVRLQADSALPQVNGDAFLLRQALSCQGFREKPADPGWTLVLHACSCRPEAKNFSEGKSPACERVPGPLLEQTPGA